jgi:septal ring factor EnvC (AmiA/AmiB activator)
MARYRFIFFFLLLVSAYIADAQSLDVLRARKEKTKKEIEYTNKLLNETGKNTKASLNKLSLLNEQIELRNNLINTYNDQLSILQLSINDNEFITSLLTEDLAKIRGSYEKLVQQAYRKRGDYNLLIFLFSSDNFNQAYKRLLYTRQMARYREQQSRQIEAIRNILEKKTIDLQDRRIEQEGVLNQQKAETSQLNVEKNEQNNYYQQLQRKEKELRQRLREQQKNEEKLQQEIERIISSEIKKTKTPTKRTEDTQLSDDFENNKGKFPWPTENGDGIITDKFGEHAHPVMKSIIVENNGIDITTSKGVKARSIFKGVVSTIFIVPGGNKAVIIRHGEYMTVYSNLTEVYVKSGDQVTIKQNIGLISTDTEEDEKTVLKFQLWKGLTKLNPEQWISR